MERGRVLIAVVFFLIAAVYSMVGFGGGSSYIAVLALFEFDYRSIPILALLCNIVVVSGGVYHFSRHSKLKALLPFVLTSVPAAYLGGTIEISRERFLLLLGITLLVSGLRMLWKVKPRKWGTPPFWGAASVGALLGLLSGVVGIGGGIFLAPLLHMMGWGRPKQIAGIAAGFILINSLAGLAGQMTKAGSEVAWRHWPLLLAVLIGGQLGARLGSSSIVSSLWVTRLTATLVLFVAGRVLHDLV